ncbi:MAG: type VI secretion system tube protein Hcp [Nitrosopumilus sp.]|nr:type VI secretion system tube protein Hcp [Nitrosopumilus sp.]
MTAIYLTLTGETQGQVKGNVGAAGHEDKIEVYGFSHEVDSPRDAASGLPTGKRQHTPISIEKPVDKSTPILYSILVSNENITELKLEFWGPDRSTGKEVLYYTVELQNASISNIGEKSSVLGSPPNFTDQVSFTYQKIIWTWNDGGITAEDDWETPVA